MRNQIKLDRVRTSRQQKELWAIEYQKAQDSAEHHDKLLWQVTGLFWAGNSVLLGLMLKSATEDDFQVILMLISAISIIMLYNLNKIAQLFGKIRRQKYDRCKQIEIDLHFFQHRNFPDRYRKGRQTKLYLLTNYLFMTIWASILLNDISKIMPSCCSKTICYLMKFVICCIFC